MEIRVETQFIPLVFELKQDAPEGVTVEIPPVMMGRTLELGTEAIAIITATLPIAVDIAKWLYEKSKDKDRTKIYVNGEEVVKTMAALTAAIEKKDKPEQRSTEEAVPALPFGDGTEKENRKVEIDPNLLSQMDAKLDELLRREKELDK